MGRITSFFSVLWNKVKNAVLALCKWTASMIRKISPVIWLALLMIILMLAIKSDINSVKQTNADLNQKVEKQAEVIEIQQEVNAELDEQLETKSLEVEQLEEDLQAKLDREEAERVAVAEAQRLARIAESTRIEPAQAFSYKGGTLSSAQMQFLGTCESGMTASRNSGNGYYGAYQFSIPTWNAMGTGYSRADLAPLGIQTEAVQKLLSRSSIFTQFPGCARQMSAIGLL